MFVMCQLVNVVYVNLDSTDTSAEVNKNLKEIKSQKKSPWLWCMDFFVFKDVFLKILCLSMLVFKSSL